MARQRKASSKRPIESYEHREEERLNNPRVASAPPETAMGAWGPQTPHPLSRMRTELVWEGKYDEYGNRRQVRLPSSPLPLQRIERIDEPRDREKAREATSHDKRPAVQAQRTMFNLVPCDVEFEQEFTGFLDTARDVAAFAKNAGPQKLMIDYLRPDGQRALYVPDFFVRTQQGDCYLVETKGRQDELVPLKASAAVAWCKSASKEATWLYLYVPYHLFQRGAAATISELARACNPSLKGLLDEWEKKQHSLQIEEETGQSQADALFREVLQTRELCRRLRKWPM